MKYTMMGTDKIPVIALGTWSWGTGINSGNGIFGNHLEEKELLPIFERGVAEGFTLWDTAAVYGMGASERILGASIQQTKEPVILSTKFTPMGFQLKNAMKKSIDASCKRLGVEQLNLYWVHSPSNVAKWTQAIIPLVRSGKVKHVGVSNHNLKQIMEVDKILKGEGIKLAAVQNHYSLLYRTSEDTGILKWCKENHVAFFSYMVLEQGALTSNYTASQPFPPKTRRSKAFGIQELGAIEPLKEVMKKVGEVYGVGLPEVAIAWAIAKGTIPIVGVTKEHHIVSANKAVGIDLQREELVKLEQAAKETGIKVRASWEEEM